MGSKKSYYKVSIILLLIMIFSLLVGCDKSSTGSDDDGVNLQRSVEWPSLADSPWPKFRHDPQLTGRTKYEGPVAALYSEIFELRNVGNINVVSDNQGYIYFSNADMFYKLSLEGDTLWSIEHNYTEDHSSPLISSDHNIYFINDDGSLYSITLEGKLNWVLNIDEYPTQINIDKTGNLYVSAGSQVNKLYKISKTGEIIFIKELGDKNIGPFSVDGRLLYVADYRNITVAAIDTAGNTIWEKDFKDSGNILTPIAVDSKDHLIFSITVNENNMPSYIFFLNQEGNIIWCKEYFPEEVKYFSIIPFYPTLDWYGNIYIVGRFITNDDIGNDVLLSFSNKGKLRWELEGIGICSVICDLNNNLYGYHVTNENNIGIVCINNDGEISWEVSGDIGFTNSYELSIGLNNSLFIVSSSWAHRYIYRVW